MGRRFLTASLGFECFETFELEIVMKKMIFLMALCATFSGTTGFAAQPNSKTPPCKPNDFAWGTFISSLAVVSVVVGLTAACATGNSD